MLLNHFRNTPTFCKHARNARVRVHSETLAMRRLSSTDGSALAKEPAHKPCNYIVEEVKIPVPSAHGGAFLAGQVWRGESDLSEKVLPPILCAHGLLDNAGSYAGLLPLIMRPNMTVLCFDFQGHGLSSHLNDGHYDLIIDCCKSLHRAYKYLNTPKVILMAHSMGSVSSFLFSALYPEFVDRFISIDAHAFMVKEPLGRLKFLMDRQMVTDEKMSQHKPSASFTYEELLERFYQGRRNNVTLEGCKTLLERGARRLPDGTYTFSYDLRTAIPMSVGRLSMVELNDICARIKCPITLIQADTEIQPPFIMPFEYVPDHDEMVRCLKKNNANFSLHVVPGNHFVHINNPGVVAPIVRASLGF